MKNLIIFLTAISLVFALASCKNDKEKCEKHIDANDDLLCDECGESYDDGEETVIPTALNCTVTVKTTEGKAVAGVKVTLTKGSTSVTLTTGSSGSTPVRLELGTYSVDFDYETLPSGFLPETHEIVVKDETALTLMVIDNNPDGTFGKPFVILEDKTQLSLAAGEQVYYIYHGAANRRLEIKSDAVTVTYGDTTYTAEGGVISVQLSSEIGVAVRFSVKNVSGAAVNTEIELISPPGSMENPYELTDSTQSVTVPAESAIHYKWAATASGYLVVTSPSANNNVGVTKTLENNVPISAQTAGSGAAYMAVTEGEELLLSVASTGKNEATIEFTLTVYEGTALDPLPVLKDEIDLTLLAGESVVFEATAGKTLTVLDEDGATVSYAGNNYTADSTGNITVTLDGTADTFTVTNTKDTLNAIDFEIK